jgi:hypothetical protein
MRAAWHEIWGSARGPARSLAPQTRIICGVAVFATGMIAPVTRWQGVAAVAFVLFVWATLVRPPASVVRSTLLLGLALFLPYFLLIPLIHDPPSGRGWEMAAGVSWTVFFRGIAAMHAAVLTATALSASALRQGLSRLPIPRLFSVVLIQIVHQTTSLIDETRRVASAIAVRGGTVGFRTGIRVIASLPRVWLPRVVDRAERVGAAMELRQYAESDLADLGVVRTSTADRLALVLAVAVVAGTAALRVLVRP